jgi:hypothetical protein
MVPAAAVAAGPVHNQKQLLPPRSTWPEDGDIVQHFRDAAQRPEERVGK